MPPALRCHRRKVSWTRVWALRKLATWQGIFDEFVYIGIDTVVLENLDVVFSFLRDFDFMTSHAYIPWIVKFVWNESIFRIKRLTQQQILFATNTGFIVSRRNALSLDDVEAKLPSALELAPHMALEYKEQPLINGSSGFSVGKSKGLDQP